MPELGTTGLQLIEVATKTFVSAKSEARYDQVTAIVTLVEPAAVAELYRTAHPFLQRAYQEIKGMTVEEQLEYYKRKSEEFQRKLAKIQS